MLNQITPQIAGDILETHDSELIGRLIHVFNNKLSIMSFLIENLIENNPDDPSSVKLSRIFDDILDISNNFRSLFCDTKSTEVLSFSLRHLFSQSLFVFRKSFSAVKIKVDEPPDIYVMCNQGKTLRAIFEILKNAAEAFENEFDYRIKCKFLQLNGQVEIQIFNNGPLIKKEDEIRIFDPYYTTKDKTSHFGLGLFYARLNCLSQHSDLSYQNKSGETVFILSLQEDA